jgi:type I restriction enzyme S subunit
MNKIGSAGKIYLMPYLNHPATLARNAFLIRFYETIDVKFVFSYLTSPEGTTSIMKHVHGAVTKTITKDEVRSIEIPLPPLSEQQEIVAHLDVLQEKLRQLKEIYTKQIANCDEIKQSFLKKAFEGEL